MAGVAGEKRLDYRENPQFSERGWAFQMQAREIALNRGAVLVIVVMALATLLMLQGTRVFVGYLVFVVDQSERVTLGLSGLAVFAAPALAWVALRQWSADRVIYASVVLLTGARGLMQVWEHPTARLVLGALTIVAWGWIAIACLDRHRLPTALGVVTALALDIMIRMGFGSIDLPWMPGWPSHLLTFALLSALALSVTLVQDHLAVQDATSARSILPLLALGPALALFHFATGNLAFGHATGETDRANIWVAHLAGVALAYFVLTTASMFGNDEHRPSDRWIILGAAIAGGFGLWLVWNGDPAGAFGVVLMPAGFLVLTAAILAGRPVGVAGSRSGLVALVFTVGLVVQVVLIFAYYTFTGLSAAIVACWIVLSAGALWSSRLPTVPFLQTTGSSGLVARVVVLLAFVMPVVGEISASEPETMPAAGDELTVMIYNIQSGFGLDRTWDLQRTADAIAAQDPDIVVLNEVSRGWLVTASSDQLVWLSRELDMEYVWGPAADDNLWGNAVLSNLDIEESQVRKFASTQNLKRSAVGVRLDVDGHELWVYGTHLDNPRGAGTARMEQVNELIEFWDGHEPAVIMGDLNADPEDDVLQELAAQGFVDPGLTMMPDATTSEDERRIDYILVTEGIEVLDIAVPDVSAADHRPVVARIRIGD